MKSAGSANYFDDNSGRILDAFRIVKQFELVTNKFHFLA